MPITHAISNTHNNPRPQVDCYTTNTSTSYYADQDIVFGEISYSYECTTPYSMNSVVFQGGKLRIGINSSIDNLKSTSTILNLSSSSVFSGITNEF